MWTLAGHGGVLVIRMGRSLIMTRLLFPEVYGLMTLVWAVLTGLQMFADTGIVPTIIRDKRGDDPGSAATAWTAPERWAPTDACRSPSNWTKLSPHSSACGSRLSASNSRGNGRAG